MGFWKVTAVYHSGRTSYGQEHTTNEKLGKTSEDVIEAQSRGGAIKRWKNLHHTRQKPSVLLVERMK